LLIFFFFQRPDKYNLHVQIVLYDVRVYTIKKHEWVGVQEASVYASNKAVWINIG